MKPSEIRSKTREEVFEELQNAKRELFNLKFQWQTEEIANSAQYGMLRRDVARMRTILREIDLGLHTDLLSRAPEQAPEAQTSESKE